MKLDKKTKDIIVNYFRQKPEVAAVYLYGSQARGDAREDSDIDLAVLLSENSTLIIPHGKYSPDLAKLTGKEVETQDLRACRVDFSHRVLTEGGLLASNNDKIRTTFEEQIFKDYFDVKPYLDEYYKELSEIAKRGEIGHVRPI